MKILKLAMVSVSAVLFAVFPYVEASAAQRLTYDVRKQGETIPGQARAWGGFTFIDSDEVGNIDQYLKDVCPGDDDPVRVRMWLYVSNTFLPDTDVFFFTHYNHSGCSSIQSWTDQYYGDNSSESQYGDVYRVRMQACVIEHDNDECGYTKWYDNPYNNDPSRANM